MQPTGLFTKTDPPARKHSSKRQTVQVASWVQPSLRAELSRLAEQEGLSISSVSATLLEEAIRQKLHIQHAVLLQPMIKQAIREQMTAYSSRLAVLLVRSSYASEQTRSLATNILSRQPGVSQAVLEDILNGSSNAAKRNITRLSQQLAGLIKEVKTWLEAGGETA
jgi:hypothetical protein